MRSAQCRCPLVSLLPVAAVTGATFVPAAADPQITADPPAVSAAVTAAADPQVTAVPPAVSAAVVNAAATAAAVTVQPLLIS